MSSEFSRTRLIGIWCIGILAAGACGIVSGADVTTSNVALLLVGGLVPPAVVLFVWNGAPPVTVAEVLHSVDTGKKGRS